ncbi:hypothetical protein [Streptomyces sp. NBC_00316]|uniref:hypothetical protein n=1 Tax=Streptomyces sp. NBC_00316 TaxID=2975710 RepID=UPI002E2E79ED|nr:hypothetical protein [Streptomyces sp. NBC_00316]
MAQPAVDFADDELRALPPLTHTAFNRALPSITRTAFVAYTGGLRKRPGTRVARTDRTAR